MHLRQIETAEAIRAHTVEKLRSRADRILPRYAFESLARSRVRHAQLSVSSIRDVKGVSFDGLRRTVAFHTRQPVEIQGNCRWFAGASVKLTHPGGRGPVTSGRGRQEDVR